MNIKLDMGLAGERFSFMPRQVIKCSDAAGKGLIAAGVGKQVPDSADTDGEFFDPTPEEAEEAQDRRDARRRAAPERAVRPTPETPESKHPATVCKGTTTMGNPCKRAPLPGSDFCAKHQEE